MTDSEEEQLEESIQQTLKLKSEDFKNVLDDIESISDKKKRLWREIYENAISDRQNAFVMFGKLARITKENSSEHAVHGRNMNAYIERMSKANDQILKLADLIAAAETSSEAINPDDLFDQINRGKK